MNSLHLFIQSLRSETIEIHDCKLGMLYIEDFYWRPTGRFLWTSIREHGFSKTTGWDLPMIYIHFEGMSEWTKYPYSTY